MTAEQSAWLAARRALERDRYRCRAARPNGRPCRRPTKNVARDDAGRLRAFCVRCLPRKESA